MGVWADFLPYSNVTVDERKGVSDRFYTLARTLVKARDTLKKPAEQLYIDAELGVEMGGTHEQCSK